MDGRPVEDVQKSFSDGDAEHGGQRMDDLDEGAGVRIGAAIHSVRAVDPASMRTVAEWARKRNAPLHIHLAEQPAEVEECLAVEGCTPMQLLDREGILGPDLTAVHAIHVNEDDISLLGANKVSICACTTTERDLGDRVGPIRALVDAGSPLCVGSDSNADIDLFDESRGVELDQRAAPCRRLPHHREGAFGAAPLPSLGTSDAAGGRAMHRSIFLGMSRIVRTAGAGSCPPGSSTPTRIRCTRAIGWPRSRCVPPGRRTKRLPKRVGASWPPSKPPAQRALTLSSKRRRPGCGAGSRAARPPSRPRPGITSSAMASWRIHAY